MLNKPSSNTKPTSAAAGQSKAEEHKVKSKEKGAADTSGKSKTAQKS